MWLGILDKCLPLLQGLGGVLKNLFLALFLIDKGKKDQQRKELEKANNDVKEANVIKADINSRSRSDLLKSLSSSRSTNNNDNKE